MIIARAYKQIIASLLLLAACCAHAETSVTYYIQDGLGSPIAAMDDAGGMIWQKHYHPYGNEYGQDPGAADEKIGFTGHIQDASTGLTYMGARYYDPRIGRFMSVDPAEVNASNPATFNRFAYANNNPYRYVDPNGKWSTEAHNYFIDKFAQEYGLGNSAIASIKAGSRDADGIRYQFSGSAHMHAMGDGVNSSETQRNKMNAFIGLKMNSYKTLLNKSSTASSTGGGRNGSPASQLRNKAYKELGFALHAAMDSTSPAHEGFQVWQWNKETVYRHGDFSGSLEDLNAAKSVNNTEKTLDSMRRVMDGEGL